MPARFAIQIAEIAPDASYSILHDNLPGTRDKQIVSVLLDFLRQQRQKGAILLDSAELATSYLENITDIKSHLLRDLVGPRYRSLENWDDDLAEWQSWWEANKDYIAWDDQTQKLKVGPH